jgi:acetoin utilization protein AcuB
MRVREAMSGNPITIDPEAPVGTAVAVMRERGLRHLPVVDARGDLLGIVTDRDLRSAALGPVAAELGGDAAGAGRLRALGARLDDVPVRRVMTWAALTIGPEVLVAQAAAVMTEARVGALPVVEAGRLIGILTEHDVLRALAATLPTVRGSDPDDYLR